MAKQQLANWLIWQNSIWQTGSYDELAYGNLLSGEQFFYILKCALQIFFMKGIHCFWLEIPCSFLQPGVKGCLEPPGFEPWTGPAGIRTPDPTRLLFPLAHDI